MQHYPHLLRPQPAASSQYQHGVAKTLEAVPLSDGFAVGAGGTTLQQAPKVNISDHKAPENT